MQFNLKEIYNERQKKVCDYLKQNNIKAALFEDSESCRDVSVRYLCGHPNDALLILFGNGDSMLVPWDVNLAQDKAFVKTIEPLCKRNYENAAKEILNSINIPKDSEICINPELPYIVIEKYSKELENFKLVAKQNKANDFVKFLRTTKDAYEIECTKKACAISDYMTEEIIKNLKSGKIKSELDVALFAERELRLQGAERTSFDTLAAGPSRSFAIHAFPGYTKNSWATQGLSILDYGVCYEGYASDCTITIAKGPLTKQQEALLDLVQQAADECIKLYKPGSKISCAVQKADEIFAKANRVMPHGLGHGTGLEIHEEPFVSHKSEENVTFKQGNIITLEPGLYDKELGGVRLENDVLITETGNEVLTHSKIFRI